MASKRDRKGKTPVRHVSIVDDDLSPRSHPASPGPSNHSGPSHGGPSHGGPSNGGPSNTSRSTGQGSPAPSHASSATQSRSRAQSHPPVPSPAASSAPAAPAPVGQQIPLNHFGAGQAQFPLQSLQAPQQFANWTPFVGLAQPTLGSPFQPVISPLGMVAQQPQPAAPAPVNPPDELGPPPPPPAPPANPPVLNPHGVHFQPQVPGTEMGPMINRYVPRHDGFAGQQLPNFMTVTAGVPMGPMPPAVLASNVAPFTGPINPIVLQQPMGAPMMIQNHSVPGGPPLMLPGPTQTIQIPGNHPLGGAGFPGQPPVHVEAAMGVGLTPNETAAQNMRVAQNNRAFEPQDFKPADPDPYRMYWIREVNGHWALFPRRQIDRLDARWCRTAEGVVYAIRVSE